MFDRTNIAFKGGNSSSSAKANASANVQINSPMVMSRSDENSQFIMVYSGTTHEHNLFDINGSHIDIIEYSDSFDKDVDGQYGFTYWKQITCHKVKILQIVCIDTTRTIVEYSILETTQLPKTRIDKSEYDKRNQ